MEQKAFSVIILIFISSSVQAAEPHPLNLQLIGLPVIDAVTRGDYLNLQRLLDEGHNPNESYDDNTYSSHPECKKSCGTVTPLIQASRLPNKSTPTIIGILLARGAELNTGYIHGIPIAHPTRIPVRYNQFFMTPILAAILSHNVEAVLTLARHRFFIRPDTLDADFEKAALSLLSDDTQSKAHDLLVYTKTCGNPSVETVTQALKLLALSKHTDFSSVLMGDITDRLTKLTFK